MAAVRTRRADACAALHTQDPAQPLAVVSSQHFEDPAGFRQCDS